MRRHAYPYARYIVKGRKIDELGTELKDFIGDFGFPIIKYDTENEDKGTLIIAVNKDVLSFIKQKKPPGRIEMILSGFPIDMPSFREMDMDSQRVGIELYLWPADEGILLEVFVLPYMGRFNRKEIYGLTESEEEEITDWYLCEHIWEDIIPKLEAAFDLDTIHKRA